MEALIKSKNTLTESLLENCAVAIFVINTQHEVIFWNKACEQLTGIRASNIIGTKNHWMAFYDFIRPCLSDLVIDGGVENGATYYSVFKKSVLLPEGLHAEGWYPGEVNSKRYIIFDAAPVYDDDNNLVAAVETLQDITDQKELQKKKDQVVDELRQAIARNKTLRGLIPICSTCKKIRDDRGYWNKLEIYIEQHSDAEFTHSLCPACEERFFQSTTKP